MRVILSRTYRFPVLVVLIVGISVSACDTFVEDVDLPINTIDDEQLNTEEQVPFLIQGVQSRFSTTYDRIAVLSGGLSDELVFDRRAGTATFPSFEEIESGHVSFANFSNDFVYNAVGELRFLSDNLLARLEKITFADADLKNQAAFIGNFYGGLARYFLATYYGISPTEGGGVISEDPDNPAPFTPSSEMYGLAIEKLNTALALADGYHTRVIYTVIARIELFRGNYSESQAAAQLGLMMGDEPFVSLHTRDNNNFWWDEAGNGRLQWVVDARFNQYVEDDPSEAARIPLIPTEGADGTIFYQQNLYPDAETPFPFATWQENELILAEVAVRNSDIPGARSRLDDIRASHGLGGLGPISLNTIISERERELFTMGMRLVDQRRFDLWHLDAGTWQYLPLTQNERNQNPNF